ncbi:MAG TPA: hypothetical protein VFC78_25105 [Tepidisphaeraceae bacterium]|nr:hypothetical protein [Tepidisphaeraceae bacterium]
MNASLIVEDVVAILQARFGKAERHGKARIYTFGSAFVCSINYSKLLGGHKYFFAVAREIVDASHVFADANENAYVVLVCGAAENCLVLPRRLMIEMMRGVPSRRVDVFMDSGRYILQTTKHLKSDISEYLNAFPSTSSQAPGLLGQSPKLPDRLHTKIQWSLVRLGRAEGCAVWVPINDRNLSFEGSPLSASTLPRLPHFGFDENTRRIVQNFDVLWLSGNVISEAFEIEATTSIYSGLLRLNDLAIAQPNNRVDLFVASAKTRRDKVRDQLLRQSFQPLLTKCRFISFEAIQTQMSSLAAFPADAEIRVSGLVRGEKFTVPEHYVYPATL